MSKLLTIFGATGQQGRSVITNVLSHPTLSKEFKIRALTRDPTSTTSLALAKQGIELVQADSSDPQSLKGALAGSHSVFALTTTTYDPQLYTREYAQGKAIAAAAVAAGVSYIIFSTLPHVSTVSGGEYKNVESFDVKGDIETYIRSLPIKSSFFHPGSFMQNFATHTMSPLPSHDSPGTFVIYGILKLESELPLIDIVGDTGKYICAILASPEKFEGRSLRASAEVMSMDEICETISRVTGKKVVYRQVEEGVYRGFMKGNGVMEENITGMWGYVRDCGYYGDDSKGKCEESGKLVGGRLTSLEEWLKKNPLNL